MKIAPIHVGGFRDPFVTLEGFDNKGRGPYRLYVPADESPRVAEEVLNAGRRALAAAGINNEAQDG